MDEEPYFKQLEELLKQLGKESDIYGILNRSGILCRVFDRVIKSSNLEYTSDEDDLQVERKKYIRLRKIMKEASQTIQKEEWGSGFGDPYIEEKESVLINIKKRIGQTQEEIDVLAKELNLKQSLEEKEMKKKEYKISVLQIIITLILFVSGYLLGKYT